MGQPWESIDAFLLARGVRVGAATVPQTTGGVHARTSLHYVARARDYGRSTSDLRRVVEELLPFAQGSGHLLQELYGPETFWKDGRKITPSFSLRESHRDHVHAGLRAGKTLPLPQVAAPPAVRLEVPPMINPPFEVVGKVVATLTAPNGGVWMLTHTGNIYALEGAPDYDMPARHPEYWLPGMEARRLDPHHGGYKVTNQHNQFYEYPPR